MSRGPNPRHPGGDRVATESTPAPPGEDRVGHGVGDGPGQPSEVGHVPTVHRAVAPLRLADEHRSSLRIEAEDVDLELRPRCRPPEPIDRLGGQPPGSGQADGVRPRLLLEHGSEVSDPSGAAALDDGGALASVDEAEVGPAQLVPAAQVGVGEEVATGRAVGGTERSLHPDQAGPGQEGERALQPLLGAVADAGARPVS